MIKRISTLFTLGEDAASEKEVIESIEKGVNFQGAKLWILVIAVFVASLGLNTNSAAVIIGAMLISPLMGPIIGMGLGAGINDFQLLRRSWKNYIVATLFSVLTATIYFFLTPVAVAQSELLARTSPTIYDVLIALCGGLAGIIALSSRSQRTGNVIPGVAIATALMPPLCTVGFGLATANWGYALGALYLFLINTVFIALATLVGAVFIMKFQKKVYMDKLHAQRVTRIIYAILFITVVPALILTVGMVRENTFEQRINQFIQHEMHFPTTQVVSHRTNFDARSFSVVLIGEELDSTTLRIARERLPLYKLEEVEMQVFQGTQSNYDSNSDNAFRDLLMADSRELHNAQTIIAQQQSLSADLERRLQRYTSLDELAPNLLQETQILFPQVQAITLARGTTATTDSVQQQIIVYLSLSESTDEEQHSRLSAWMKQRLPGSLVIMQ